MSRIIKIEQHAVFATLEDGSKHRVSDWMDWIDAQDMWTAMDDQRREAMKNKGLLAVNRFPGKFERIKHYEVRSENDPNYAHRPQMYLPGVFRVLSREYTTDIAAAKGVLKPLGYLGHEGGWVTTADDKTLVAQGWWKAAKKTGHLVLSLDNEDGYRAVVTTALLVKQNA